MSQDLIARVEELTEELHGRQAAVSVDQESGGWRVRLWDGKGYLIEETDEPLPKERALRAMLRRMTT